MSESPDTAPESVERPRATPGRESALGTSTLLLLLAWPLLVVAAGGYYLEQRRGQDLATALADRPRVVVINEADFIRKAPNGLTPEATIASGIRAADDTAAKLSAAGYIVIKRSAVASAPDDARVSP